LKGKFCSAIQIGDVDNMGNIKDFSAIVLKKTTFSDKLFMLRVLPEERIKQPNPGQFFLLKSWEGLDPLLFRPFAPVLAHEDGSLDFLIKVVGKGTQIIRSCMEGAKVKLRGPCGNSFPDPAGQRLILIGGAVGIAPMVFSYMNYEKKLPVKLILGVPGAGWDDFCESDIFSNLDLEIFSDDGSIGRKGTPLTLFEKGEIGKGDEIWACGPIGMLKALGTAIDAVKENQIYVSLEARMACGIGGCLGCTIPTKWGPRRVCADGPVFKWAEVSWNEL